MTRLACIAFSAAALVAAHAHAASSSSANFITPRDVVGSGGTSNSSSANYSMGGTLGQPVVGKSTSADFGSIAGFWAAGSIAFTLTAQTNVPIVTVVTSNVITVSGLSGPAAISIVGGTYSINGGAYVSTGGTVNNGDTVTVRQTSSSTYGATTIATLTIDGVSGDFSVTTNTAPATTLTITGPNAAPSGGTITAIAAPGPGQPASCGFDPASQYIPLVGGAQSPPAASDPPGVIFPFGLFDFILLGCAPGGSVTITVTYPQAVPAGSQYWKYGGTAANNSPHWYVIPVTFSGNTATFTLTDGGLGDDDMAPNGIVIDQGGPGFGGPALSSNGIPTLSEWSMLILTFLTVLLGFSGLARRTRANRSS